MGALAVRILIVWGGWIGHQPRQTAEQLARLLEARGHDATVTSDCCVVLNEDLSTYDTIVPVWSCGIQGIPYVNALASAVRDGLGLACFHGGIDWFDQKDYYVLIGGLFIGDASNAEYRVHMDDSRPDWCGHVGDFSGSGEVSHCMCDRENDVLANVEVVGTSYPYAWTRQYGKGKVFYSMGAHQFDSLFGDDCMGLILAGIEWSAREHEDPR
jgi:uncharacterized protein